MDFHGQKVNLSFSIENILRDDFSRHRPRTNFVSFHTAGDEAGFERRPTNPVVYQCCAVRYSPVYLSCPPNMQTAEGRLLKKSGGKDQFFREQTKVIEEDSVSCKGEEVRRENGKNFNVTKPRLGSTSIEWQFFIELQKSLFERKALFSFVCLYDLLWWHLKIYLGKKTWS